MKVLTLDDYEITKDGKIINAKTKRILKAQPNGKGYLRVSIGGKLMFVHRLVAQKYIKNPLNLPQVNHKDGNKQNNCVDNLEWVTNKENRIHALNNGLHLCGEKCSWAKLKKDDVIYIRNHKELTDAELSKMFGVSQSSINGIRNYRTWKTVEKIC